MSADVAGAREAVEHGQRVSEAYYAAAIASPGVGAAVALPSYVAPSGPSLGLGYDLPESVPALRPAPARPPAAASVATTAVGGEGFAAPGGLLGVGQYRPNVYRSESAIEYVSLIVGGDRPAPLGKAARAVGTKPSWLRRVVSRLTGR
jgi:hypothetical protein